MGSFAPEAGAGAPRAAVVISPFTCTESATIRFRPGPPRWVTTATGAQCFAFRLVGPGDESENKEEDEDDLELESDEDHRKLRIARARPGTEDGSPAARGDDGTINPPFP